MTAWFYLAYVLIDILLIGWALRLWRGSGRSGPFFLALVLFGLAYDSAIVALGRWLPAGPLLEALSWPRFILHQLILPWIIVSAFEQARAAGLGWAAQPWSARLAWGGAALVMVLGILTRLVGVGLRPEVIGGLTRYVAEGVSGPPLVSIVSVGFVGVVGLLLWRAQRWPWTALLVLAVFIVETLPMPDLRLVLGAALEVVLLAALLILEARLTPPPAPARA